MKRFCLFILVSFCCIATSAEKITEQQALQKAQEFMQGKKILTSAASARGKDSETKMTSQSGFYIFNTEGGNGFVLVSADDRMPDILGYSEKGSLEYSSAPSNVRWLLDYYNKVAQRLSTNATNKTRASKVSHPNITPLIYTKWGQGNPYNTQCPVYKGDNCVTGCVATALAQVINNNRWPIGKTGEVEEYTSWGINTKMPKLESTQFDWDNMTKDDIARLMLYCGQAVQMDYGQYESGANPAMEPIALAKVFGYSQTARYVERASYSEDDWDDLIYDELANQRAVIYNGFDKNGGHTFVVHGYKDGKFCINWGWNGDFDGYFMLTKLVAGGGAYNDNQSATISIRPMDVNNPDVPKVLAKYLNIGEERYFVRRDDGNFPIIGISGNLAGEIIENSIIKIGVGLYDNNGLVKVLWEEQREFPVGEEIWFDASLPFEGGIPDGNYQILPIHRMSEDQEWMADGFSSEYYAEVKIENNLMRIVTHPLDYRFKDITDLGVHEIDGLTYFIYKDGKKNQSKLLRSLSGRYTGDIVVPDVIKFEGEEYNVSNMSSDALTYGNDITSLSLGVSELYSAWGMEKLEKLELREGINTIWGAFGYLNLLENIEFPKSLSYISTGGVAYCQNIKTIRFKTTGKLIMDSNPEWDENSLPSLTDVYFSMATPPVISYKREDIKINPNVTIHIPKGTKAEYENSDWSAWKLEEDLPEPEVHLVWGYYRGDDVSTYGVGCNQCGDNDCDAAINVPAAMLTAYKGAKISSIEFYVNSNDGIEYVFITKSGTDYLVKLPVEFNITGWAHVDLEEPLEITGEELYVGYGRHGFVDLHFWTDEQEAPEGVWVRAMGPDTNCSMVPGKWENLAMQDPNWNHPIAVRFEIIGDKMPKDIAFSGTKLIEENKAISIQTEVVNRSLEMITSYTLAWDIDNGQEKGELKVNSNLLTNHGETKTIELPQSLNGRNHSVTLTVKDVNGVEDAVPANSTFTTTFTTLPNTFFPRRIVMEEGTGTWCGYCVRGIETIERLSKEYPDNFIGIALHNSDEMANMENYSAIANRFSEFPSCIINRTSPMDPNYPEVKDVVEKLKDGAEAKITASAVYASKDYSSVTVNTETTFGFSDNTTADYRIAYVVVEDNVGPYVQSNYYSGEGLSESDYMYGWSQKGAKVKIEFNEVARGIYGGVNGMKGSVPTDIKEGEKYEYEYSFILPKNIQDKNNISIVTLLIDNNSDEIVNADKTSVVFDQSVLESNLFNIQYQGTELPNKTILDFQSTESGGKATCSTGNEIKLVVADGTMKQGSATLEIKSNTIDPDELNFIVGSSTESVIGKTIVEKSFTTDPNGTLALGLNASGLKTYGELEATLTIQIDGKSKVIGLLFKHELIVVNNVNKGNDEIWWYNYDNNIFTWPIEGTGNKERYHLATHVTYDMVGGKGTTVDGYSFFPIGEGTKNATVWVSKTLPNTDKEADLEVVSIPDKQLLIGDFDEVAFLKRHEIPEEGLYVGCSFDITDLEKDRWSSVPIVYTDSEKNRDGAFWYKTERSITEWVNHQGNLIAKVLFGSNSFINDRVKVKDFPPVYCVKGQKPHILVTLVNEGTIEVNHVLMTVSDKNGNKQNLDCWIGLQPFSEQTYDFVIDPASSQGVVEKTITLTTVNDLPNKSTSNVGKGLVITLNEVPKRTMVMEEFTGTWCGWCTRGMVALDKLEKMYGDDIILIAAHNSDPMETSDYDEVMALTDGYPTCTINRDGIADPYFGYQQEGFGIVEIINNTMHDIVPGNVKVRAIWNDADQTLIDINAWSKFEVDANNLPLQIGFVLLADSLQGMSSAWAQNNYYSGNSSITEPDLLQLVSKPDRLVGIKYNHVPVAAWGAYKGLEGTIPETVMAGADNHYSFKADISENIIIQNKDNLSVVALLIDKGTGKILNAAKCKIEAYGTGIVNLKTDNEMGDIFDLSGRKVKANSVSMKDLPKGIYIVNGKKVVVK